jgi:hypothetical protein
MSKSTTSQRIVGELRLEGKEHKRLWGGDYTAEQRDEREWSLELTVGTNRLFKLCDFCEGWVLSASPQKISEACSWNATVPFAVE